MTIVVMMSTMIGVANIYEIDMFCIQENGIPLYSSQTDSYLPKRGEPQARSERLDKSKFNSSTSSLFKHGKKKTGRYPVSPSSIADHFWWPQHLSSLILRVYYTLISKVSITPLCDYVGSWMGPIIENSDGGGWIFFTIEHVDASTVRAVQIW